MLSQLEVGGFVAGLLAFWLLINLLDKAVSLEKYGVKVSTVFIKYESRRLKAFINKTAQKRPAIWKVFSNLSVALGAGLTIFAIYFLTDNLLNFVKPGGQASPVVPVLPGLTIRVYWLPYFVLAFLVAVLTHEMAHGIVARIEGINIKSAGVFFALVQPGGFVEPDKEDLENSSTVSQMRVLSAGSSMNLLVGIMIFLLVSLLFYTAPSGIVIMEILENGPLDHAGLRGWDVIYAINGTRIETGEDLRDFMANVAPGDRLILSTSRGDVSITAVSHPDELNTAIIGVKASTIYYPSRLGLGFFWDVQLYTALNWISLLLMNLAIVNMLPIPLLDGDRFLQSFLQKYAKRNNWMKIFFNAASLFLIAANMALSMGSGLFSF